MNIQVFKPRFRRDTSVRSLPIITMEGNKKIMKLSQNGALDSKELIQAAGLFRRAVQHGQSQEIKEAIVKNASASDPNLPYHRYVQELNLVAKIADNMPEFLLQPNAFVKQHYNMVQAEGGMNDATKRRRDVDAASSIGEADWERITQFSGDDVPVDHLRGIPSYAGGPSYPAPMPESSTMRMPHGHLNALTHVSTKIDIPEGMTLERWGNEVCKMDKVVDLKLSYRELIELAKTDYKIGQYMNWIIGKYGTQKVGLIPEKITPAVDLAFYLEAVGWRWETSSRKATTFVRQQKY